MSHRARMRTRIGARAAADRPTRERARPIAAIDVRIDTLQVETDEARPSEREALARAFEDDFRAVVVDHGMTSALHASSAHHVLTADSVAPVGAGAAAQGRGAARGLYAAVSSALDLPAPRHPAAGWRP